MSRRREKRNFLALPVRASRIDSAGSSSRYVVCTLDLSASGARVMGLPEIAVGQEVVLEHKKHRVRFQAVWVGEAGSARQGQVGLRSLDPDKRLADIDEFQVGDYVDDWEPSGIMLEGMNDDRRAVQRFDCDRGVQYWTEDAVSPSFGQLDNISLNGCFVITSFPMPRRTRLRMVLSLYGMKISAKGEVRTCWDSEGMGMTFTGLDKDSEWKLKQVVQRLSSTSASRVAGGFAPTEAHQAEQILENVRAWFDRNLSMSWEDFFDIQVRSKGSLVSASPENAI